MAKQDVVDKAVKHVYGDDYLKGIDEEEHEQLLSDASVFFDVFFKSITDEAILWIKLNLNNPLSSEIEDEFRRSIIEYMK